MNMSEDKGYTLAIGTPADAKDIVDFFNAAGAESVNMSFGENEYRFTAAEEEANLIKMAEDKSEVRVTVRDTASGQLVGTGSTYTHGRRSKHVFGLGIAVRQSHWGKGIGRAMMERLMSEAVLLGAEKLALDLNANNDVALKLYESLGFLVEGRLKRAIKIGDDYIDLIVMGKQLS